MRLYLIEKDWESNSFCLSEEEIIEIYRLEGATLSEYEKEVASYEEKTNCCLLDSAEERLLWVFLVIQNF